MLEIRADLPMTVQPPFAQLSGCSVTITQPAHQESCGRQEIPPNLHTQVPGRLMLYNFITCGTVEIL